MENDDSQYSDDWSHDEKNMLQPSSRSEWDWSIDWSDPQQEQAAVHMHDPLKGDTYSCIALGACRLRVVELENELSEALTGVRPLGVGLDNVMRIQTKLDKARNQMTLLEREYVRQ